MGGPRARPRFVQQGVVPAFAGGAERYVAGIGLGNEPDISYGYDLRATSRTSPRTATRA